MRKLVLDLEDLDVESFEAAEESGEPGTVRGQEDGPRHELSNTWCPTNCLSDPCYCHISEAGC